MPIIIGLISVVFGLLCIFAKDTVWGWTRFDNDMKGVASSRTETWDTTTTISGVAAIVLGIIVVYAGFR